MPTRTRSRADRRNPELHLASDGETLLVVLRRVAQAHEHLADALQTLVRNRSLDPEVRRRPGAPQRE